MKNIVLEEQMELSLSNAENKRKAGARKKKTNRAGWWFGQMRQIVDKAIDWKARPLPRSHQAYLGLERQETMW